jgi:hypothetical protein
MFVKYVKFVNVKNLVSTLYTKRLALQCIRDVGSNPSEGVQQNVLILEQGLNRTHLGLAFLSGMTGDQITKVKLTNVSEILVQA